MQAANSRLVSKEQAPLAATLNREPFEISDMTVKRRNKNILNLSLAISSNPGRAEVAAAQDKIKLLKLLVVELQRELESLSNGHMPDVERGLDFYHEVSRFEIELIRRTLIFMGGHQGNAAQHLNMKATTLSAKIKHYCAQLGPLVAPTTTHKNGGDG
jgi:DNA-binding NtrC family response regulator